MRKVLLELVDFELLNVGEVRLIVNAVDVATGQEQVYDSSKMTITVDHLMASSAFPVLFKPELIDERHMVDGGLAANLPVLPLFQEPPGRAVRCLAFDLVSARGNSPSSIDEALQRTQDLLLSAQSKRSLDMAEMKCSKWKPGVSLLHIAYNGYGEVGGKMLEFSSSSVKIRRGAGETDAASALAWLQTPDDMTDCLPTTMKPYKFGCHG